MLFTKIEINSLFSVIVLSTLVKSLISGFLVTIHLTDVRKEYEDTNCEEMPVRIFVKVSSFGGIIMVIRVLCNYLRFGEVTGAVTKKYSEYPGNPYDF